MGEIKSTLDLVMERTKHLTLSEAEKKEQENDELRKKIRGVLQKYQDGVMERSELAADIERLRKTDDPTIDHMLKKEIFEKLDLDRENQPFLGLLAELCGIDIKPFEAVFRQYREDVSSAAQHRSDAIKENLEKQRSISGAAVVPNLENDAEWLTQRKRICDQYSDALEKEKSRT